MRRVICRNKNCRQTFSKLEVSPSKTWNLVSPMPDKQGRITITIMGTYPCPHCGRNNTSVVSKFKDSEEGEQRKSKQEQLIELLESQEQVDLTEVALQFGFAEGTVEKAVEMLIGRGQVQGHIKDGMFIRQ